MTFIPRDTSLFWQDGSKASYIPCPRGQAITISNLGNTLYYKSTSSVTSGSSDGSIATAANATLTAGVFVICATGVQTQVFVQTTEGVDGNLRIAGTESVGAAGGPLPLIANVAATSLTQGTDTTNASGTELCSSIFVPVNFTVGHIACLNGSVSATDKIIYVLYDSSGAVIANTTVTANGTLAANAATWQSVALTAAVTIPGPALYYVGARANGTGSRFRTQPAASQPLGNWCQTNTVTHATVAAFTPLLTFTADQGPYVQLLA